MATRRYSVQRGDRLQDVVEAVGAATVTKSIELTVDLAVVQSREEVLLGLERFVDWITQGNWPPA